MLSERARERPDDMAVKFFVNGAPAEFDGPEEVPLLWVVREHVRLTGSKFGCGIGVCGACTMHLDGAAVRTCVMPVVMAQGRHVTTIEGLSRDGDHPVQKAWTSLDVPQCGYCQSGPMRGSAPPSTSPPSCGEVFIRSYNRAARKTDVIREDTYAGNCRA